MNWADAHLPAIVEAWYPGGEGGAAVAGLLAGDFSPAGRLPVTFYRSADQLPAFKDYGMAGRTYRYFQGEALYPFGHGLSYTRFAYGKPVLARAAVKAGEAQTVSVDVTNSGGRDGDEVVQLYVSRDVAGAPVRSLHGFQRVRLKAGETRRVSFALDGAAMSVVAADGTRSIAPGPVKLWIGGGQPVSRPGMERAPGVDAAFTVEGTKGWRTSPNSAHPGESWDERIKHNAQGKARRSPSTPTSSPSSPAFSTASWRLTTPRRFLAASTWWWTVRGDRARIAPISQSVLPRLAQYRHWAWRSEITP